MPSLLTFFVIDGQKVAKKVSSQISSETKVLRSLMEDYNTCQSVGEYQPIAFDEALDPTSIECRLQALGVWCQGTVNPEKRDIMDSYLMLCRSKEDLCMLKEEAQNILTFYETRRNSLLKVLEEVKSAADNYYSRGITSLLHAMLGNTKVLLHQAQKAIADMCEENEDELYSSDSDLEDYSDVSDVDDM